MSGLKVQCPNCKKVIHETTDKYDPTIPPNGSMVRLLEPYKSNHWPIFGDGVMQGTAATKRAEMDCPSCLAQLAPSGKLRVLEVPETDEVEVKPEESEVPKTKKSKAKKQIGGSDE